MNATDVAAAALAGAPDALYVTSLGTATSALRKASDDGPHFYLGGAMACALAAALGVAEACPQREVVAIVGDGELLMGANTLWSMAGLRPPNLTLVILDDGAYSITGGQDVVAPSTFGPVTAALPGLTSIECGTAAEVTEAVRSAARPVVVVAKVAERVVPGPSPFVDCPRVTSRFREYAAADPV